MHIWKLVLLCVTPANAEAVALDGHHLHTMLTVDVADTLHPCRGPWCLAPRCDLGCLVQVIGAAHSRASSEASSHLSVDHFDTPWIAW